MRKSEQAGIQQVGLLGTRFTMEEDFYASRLSERFGLRVKVPNGRDREIVNRVIYEELVKGEIRSKSKAQYVEIMERMVSDGCEGVILGCTEIGLLVGERDCRKPLFDTARIHAEAAVEYALRG